MTSSQSPSPAGERRPGSAPPIGPPGRGGPTDPSHDEELRRGILHTTVSRPVAGMLVAVFLAVIYSVPVSQAVLERVKGDESVLPDLFRQWPTRDSIKQFEEDLDKASYARDRVRPQLQMVLTRFGGFGNTKAVVGKDGWLFYQPGVAAVGGPGLLDAALLASRAKTARDEGSAPLYPDPRPAILDFRTFLASRGIKLVVFPVPDKAGLQPAQLHGRVDGAGTVEPRRNPDHARLIAELEAAGVLVFDPTPARLDPRQPPRYLQQDTHWTPAWMEEVARALGTFVSERVPLQAAARPRHFAALPRTVSRVGDVVDMLGLPAGQTLFRPQTVAIHEVRNEAGSPFEPQPDADVLLLGDSFCNIYTLGQMGWGEAAGLGPQLARALGRDVDIIAQNDAGASATRRLLWNELSGVEDSRQDRLAGKKVVIWEFASRELAVGNWKPVDWPRGRSTAAGAAQ
jgi:hypothetical protein